MTRGLITTRAALRERCAVDPRTHCWIWLGGTNGAGAPSIWAYDHARHEKRTMTGTVAAWNIAFGAAPMRGALVYRACANSACVNPVHLREARSRKEIGATLRAHGTLKGKHHAAKCANLLKARAAAGIVSTPTETVLAVRAAPSNLSLRAIADEHNLKISVVQRIRRGLSRRDVRAEAA